MTRRTSVVLGVLAVIVVLGGGAAAAYFTPLMSVRNVDVVGASAVDEDRIRQVAQAPSGRPLLQVDTVAIADRVAAVPEIEEVTVSRHYPSTLTIDVTERRPLVSVEFEDRIGVMDRLGVVYLTFADRDGMPRPLAELPVMHVDRPGAQDPTTQAVLTVVGELPRWLADRTASVEASSPADITLVLRSGRRAVWGDAERTADKAAALREVTRIPGEEFNVSSPEFPAVR